MLQKILDMFKKPFVAWVAAAIMALTAGALKMSYDDVKAAVCSAPAPTQPVK